MISLFDVNFLVALAWPNHQHHELAESWFHDHYLEGWATCPATQSGFLRISSNPKIPCAGRSPEEALELLEDMVRMPYHVFWIDDLNWPESVFVAPERIRGYRQITDAHLLALALRHGGRFVTLDRGISDLMPDRHGTEGALVVVRDEEPSPQTRDEQNARSW